MTQTVESMQRRQFLQRGGCCLGTVAFLDSASAAEPQPKTPATAQDRARGLLMGGLLGDALGGPIEFLDKPATKARLTNAREWPDSKTVNPSELDRLGKTIPLLDYRGIRDDTAAYGPWRRSAPAGTVTDDSRHKIVLVRAMALAKQMQRQVSRADLARAFIDFKSHADRDESQDLQALNEEGLREYRYASQWVLGERDLQKARPLARLWAGVNNCSGQMMFPPLAIPFAGQPSQAYLATYELNFIDAPMARDMCAGIVAGLAACLSDKLETASDEQRMLVLLDALRNTDPFGYVDVPYAGRRLHHWMDKAQELAERADGKPKELYRLLEQEGKPVFWWDAHFTLLVPLCILHFCDYHPLAALHLTLDFGHDTDSYAQLLGCIIGAIHGVKLFPADQRERVLHQLQEDYGEDVEGWLEVLSPT